MNRKSVSPCLMHPSKPPSMECRLQQDRWLDQLHPLCRRELISSSLNLESDTMPEQNKQRQRRKDEQAESTTWQLKRFEHVVNDPTCASPSYVCAFSFSSFLFKESCSSENGANYLFPIFHRYPLTFPPSGSETYTYPIKWTHRQTDWNTLTIYNFHAPHHEYRRIPRMRTWARTRNRRYVCVQGELAFMVWGCW